MPATPELEIEHEPFEADDWLGRTLLGRYEVHGLIAEGGMGRVYRGVQRALSRPVAIKRIHPGLLSSAGIVERFMHEARVVSSLTHPNIVRTFDFGQTPADEGGDFFLVMELLDGVDLEATLGTLSVPPSAWGVDILVQVLAALEEAHGLGITHRDIKPENVFLTQTRAGRDHVKLIDFGIAQARGVSARVSGTETVGTPHYMSPEQIQGEEGDASADLYAVGVILFRMLTGRMLFEGPDVPGILYRHLTEAPPDPRDVAPDRYISEALAEVCLKATALDRTHRYASADEMSHALSAARPTYRAPAARQTPAVPSFLAPSVPQVPSGIGSNPPVSGRYTMVNPRKKR